jgi:hypothetical protein
MANLDPINRPKPAVFDYQTGYFELLNLSRRLADHLEGALAFGQADFGQKSQRRWDENETEAWDLLKDNQHYLIDDGN